MRRSKQSTLGNKTAVVHFTTTPCEPNTAHRGKEKIQKPEKPKDVGHSRNFDFCTCPNKIVIERNASGKGHAANVFLSRLLVFHLLY